jgi:ERCC4-related helicase
LFTGADNVDRWSEQRIWDSALADMQVIISTHAVLADALGHGFVRITRLSLLIFDEGKVLQLIPPSFRHLSSFLTGKAHHCARKHPANRIMQDFYHPALKKFGRSVVPRILGLTASPIMRSKPSELELVFTFSHPVLLITEPRIIEANLDSISRTPRIQRQEMLQHVHRPVLRKLDYHALDDETSTFYSRALQNLISVSLRMDIRKDPHVLRLLSNKTSPEILEKIFSTGKTYCREQVKKFRETAKHICVELGQWAADYFILESIKRLKRAVNAGAEACFGWENDEKVYLLQELTQVAPREVETYFSVDESLKFSPKVERLISFLIAEDRPDFSGLLFVRQRATVSVLTTLLSTHPETKDRFQCAPFVGTSNSASKKHSICELLDVRQQTDTLTHFREGQKNLIIATDVLEEGIDIPVCHLVICFDPPANLKSFVQRRGRARQMESTFAIMAADNDPLFSFARWQNLEEDMIRTYQDDARQLKEISALESTSEDVMDKIEIESTG